MEIQKTAAATTTLTFHFSIFFIEIVIVEPPHGQNSINI